MSNFTQALLGVLAVSSIPVVGLITLSISRQKLDKYTHLLVSFAVGALLGNSILHLLPEIFEETTNPTLSSILIILGIVLFYSLEQFLRWHHGHETTDLHHKKPIAFMNILGDSVHNFLDGLLIAGSFLVSAPLGWATVVAVVLHEIPQEIADFSILLYAKWSIKRIIIVNIFSGLLAVVGVLVGYLANSTFDSFALATLSLTAGGFIYIACTDLIPDLHNNGATNIKQRIGQLAAIALGVSLFAIL